MGIQEIEAQILEDAQAQAGQIKKEADKTIQDIEKVHAQKKAALISQISRETEQKSQAMERSILVPARLKAKKSILEEKQKIITQVYAEIGKAKNLSKAELEMIREKSEVKVASILYG